MFVSGLRPPRRGPRTKDFAVNRTSRIGSALIAGALLLGAAGTAHATLGGDVASIQANQTNLGAERKVETLATGQRHQLRTASGTLVQQYVSPAGVVYAVSWSGRQPPDLGELLGATYAPLVARHAPGRRRTGHHQLIVRDSDLVVTASGHNRQFVGRAWVPSLVPMGIDPQTFVEVSR